MKAKGFRLGLVLALLAALSLLILSCDDNPTDAGGSDGTEVDTYFATLPGWTEFCPPEAEFEPVEVGDPVDMPSETLDVEVIGDEEDESYVVEDVVYSCQTQTYTMADTPAQIVTFSPAAHVLYPGALIQGQYHADGVGSIQPLPIAERTPVLVSIPQLPSGDNYREVVPNQATVGAAIGEMIGDATIDGLTTPSSIDFKLETFHSERQWALDVGVSANYLNFSTEASGSFSETAATSTVSACFIQKMYEVVVEAPQTPGDFFSSEFTQERLQEQIDLGRIGPDNIPVYVASVVYGRMMMFTLTSTASEHEIRGTLTAAYNGLEGDISTTLSARQRNILSNSQMTICSIGGPADATIAAIQSGNWQDYFTVEAELTTAVPLSYTLVNLGDGSIASVTETSTYNVRECTAGTGSFSIGGEEESDFLRPVSPHTNWPFEDFMFLYPRSWGDCEFGGFPINHRIAIWPKVTETSIELTPSWDAGGGITAQNYGDAKRTGENSQGLLWYDSIIFTSPPGWRIASIGGMAPDEWVEYAKFGEINANQDWVASFVGTANGGTNPHFTAVGNVFEAKLIGDLPGNDFIDCSVGHGLIPTGVWALKMVETEVVLECIDCSP